MPATKSVFYIFLLIVCTAFVYYPLRANAASLYAIIVGDTAAKSLKTAVNTDIATMHDEFRQISYHTGLTLELSVLKGATATPENVIKTVKEIPAAQDDVIIFYFSGHGFRTPKKDKEKDLWPNLFFTIKAQGIDLSMITTILSDKQSRLLIILVDCCNNLIPDQYAPQLFVPYRKAIAFDDRAHINYCKLFLETFGGFIIATAEPGEFSWAKSTGSIYTQSFIKNLHAEILSFPGEAEWDNILNLTALEVSDYEHPMHVRLQDSLKASDCNVYLSE